MRVLHHIGLRATEQQRKLLESNGVINFSVVDLPGAPHDQLVTFDVYEDDPRWAALSPLLRQWKVTDSIHTEFSEAEVISAKWLELSAWHHGYPQPEEKRGYLRTTYSLKDWCASCGIGKKQVEPFRMKREPKWNGNSLLQLTWVYDEIFVSPAVWAQCFKPHAIGCRPVLSSTGAELQSVVQLVIWSAAQIDESHLVGSSCPACGRARFQPVTQGPFPRLTQRPAEEVARTTTYFGSGALAYSCLVVSQLVARGIVNAGFQGARLRPTGNEVDL